MVTLMSCTLGVEVLVSIATFHISHSKQYGTTEAAACLGNTPRPKVEKLKMTREGIGGVVMQKKRVKSAGTSRR